MIDKVTTLRWMPLLMALFFASCQSDDLTIPTDMPQGMKIVTVDFQLPDDKPAFHEEGQSRAATGWTEGDELLMRLAVRNIDEENLAAVWLTLKYDGSAWNVNVEKSYSGIKLGGNISVKPYKEQPLLSATQDLSLTSLTLMLDENFGEVDEYGMNVYYAPDIEWVVDNEGNNSFQLKANATTTAPEEWYAKDTNKENSSLDLQWENNLARLRVKTGVKGDVVTLTSSTFTPNDVAIHDGIYTATTQDDGYAYFYGTMEEQTKNFKLELTAIGGTALAPPVTLLEASALVPVKLEAGKAYWLDASAKRNNVSQQ